MQDKIIFLLIFIYLILVFSLLTTLPGLIIKNDFLKSLPKKVLQTYLAVSLHKFFNLEFYLDSKSDIVNKIHENPDKIDIIVSNHMSTIDFVLVTCLLNTLNINSYNFVLREGLLDYPGFGLILYANDDIKVKRKWEEDKDIINKQLDDIKVNNINKTVIIIFSEGTRMTQDKLEEGQKFSKDNNLPIYNNLLVPKTKGLWAIINNLSKRNILGRVWTTSLIMPEFLGKACYMEHLTKKGSIGDIFVLMRELKLDNIENHDLFKKWFLNEWSITDNNISNYKSLNYKKLEFNDNKENNNIISLVGLIGLLLLMKKEGRNYFIISLIVSYVMVYMRL